MGPPKGLSDTQRDFHALAWMEYGYLERGELSKAKECIEEIRPLAEREETTDRIKATFANMKARYMLETGDWNAYPIPVDELLKIPAGRRPLSYSSPRDSRR